MNQIKQVILNEHLVSYSSSVVDENINSLNVIFIHGWLSNSDVWHHLMHALNKANINSYALDLPGFGKSQIPSIDVDNNFYASVVESFINKLGLSNIVLVGHSNGGAIATKLSVSSNNVKKLVLIDSSGIRKKTIKKKVLSFIAKIVKPVFKIKILSGFRKNIYKVMGSSDYINSKYLGNTFNNIVSEDISSLFQKIKIPTLIFWGNTDTDTPLNYAKFINKSINGSELIIVEGGHYPFLDKPEVVINSLIKFIKK